MEAERLYQFKEWLEESSALVFFGGAGVSTESGIPDFRSVDGIYHQRYEYPPETIISHSFFMTRPREFYEFYRDKMIYQEAVPNITHRKLAEMEQRGKQLTVVTQNIDGLHQMAGSKKVYELHGSIHKNNCMDCHKFYELASVLEEKGIPRCGCGGIIKPDVVLYEEPLSEELITKAVRSIKEADMLIVAGTSLSVYPAAGLVEYFRGKHLVLINKTPTPFDHKADLLLQCSMGEIFSYL